LTFIGLTANQTEQTTKAALQSLFRTFEAFPFLYPCHFSDYTSKNLVLYMILTRS